MPAISDGLNVTGHLRRLCAAALVLFACAGCYDGEQLVEQVRDRANRLRLEEIDLGTYRTTMPRNSATASFTDVQFRIFGSVASFRRKAIEQQLEDDVHRLRHETLTAVRQSTPEELTDPELAQLRQRITEVVNGLLDDAKIDSVGFAEVRFMYH